MIVDCGIFILGLVFGSFLSAFSYRFPRDISISKGRSFCPKCKTKISWYDNIPVISYLVLKGRCRNCKKPISLRYPLIELTTGVGFLFIYLHFYPDFISTLFYLLIYCVLVLIFVTDLEHQIIPDDFIFFGFGISFLYFILHTQYSILLFPNLFSGFFSASLILSIFLLTRGRGMGLGDVKFAILGGMVAGLGNFLIWLFASFLTGGMVGIILILGKRARLKDKIAFGPFLVIGLVIAVIWGEKISHLLLLN